MSSAERPLRVLLIDREDAVLRALTRVLTPAGYEVLRARSYEEALAAPNRAEPDILLIESNASGADAPSLIGEIKRSWPQAEIILTAGFDALPQAIAGVKAGAFDLLLKPFESLERALLTIEKAGQHRRLKERLFALEEELSTRRPVQDIVAQSPKMRRVLRLVEVAAPSPANVLLSGENGTGKGRIARLLHDRSPRRERPFISVHCGALSEPFLEHELFGARSGAFPGAKDRPGLLEAADGGTFFLEAIEELPPALQAKFLSFLQTGQTRRFGDASAKSVDVRVIAATRLDLAEVRRAGALREDLYRHLNVLPIKLPPLRERKEDIPLLAAHFLKKHGRILGKAPRGFTSDAILLLQQHPFPGNVRELESLLERALLVCEGDVLTEEDLAFAWEMADEAPPEVRGAERQSAGRAPTHLADPPRDAAPSEDGQLSYTEAKQRALESFDRSYLTSLLFHAGGNVSVASRQAGLDRSNFRRLLRRYGLDPRSFQGESPEPGE